MNQSILKIRMFLLSSLFFFFFSFFFLHPLIIFEQTNTVISISPIQIPIVSLLAGRTEYMCVLEEQKA